MKEIALKEHLQLFTVGQLATLADEEVADLQAALERKQVRGRLNLAREVQKARNLIATGLPDYEEADAQTLADVEGSSEIQELCIMDDEEFQWEEDDP